MKMKKMLVILLCVAMIFTLAACQTQESKAEYKVGNYTASATGKNGPIKIETMFAKDKIESIKIIEHKETEGYADGALESIPSKIVSEQTLAIDTVSGATFTSNAILEAVEDCIVQAGGDVAALKVEKKESVTTKVEEVDYDVVVVGAGAAGTSAALAASEKSDKVLLLEKTANPMGAGTLAGGMFAAESSLQKKAGKTVSKEWLYEEYMKSSSGYMNSVLVRKIIDESSETVNWLIKNGMELNLIDAGVGLSYENVGRPATLHGYNEGGTVAITKLIKKFEDNKGTTMFATPATELIKDDSGKITGVVATKEDGSKLKINAKAVVIATGGFGGNIEMLKEQIGNKYTQGQVASSTGDGIKMAWSAGADEYGSQATHYFAQTFTPEEFGALIESAGEGFYSLTDFTLYPHLRVNTLGQRFSDETTATKFGIHGAQVHMQPNQTEYIILDTSILKKIAKEGYASVEEHYSAFKNNQNFYMEFNEPVDTDKLIEKEQAPTDYIPLLKSAEGTGVVFSGNDLEELAKKMGVNANTFTANVEQYNKAIESGKDNLFFSDTKRLVPLEKGPYYAVKFVARNLSTLGGVGINEKIEAIDGDGVAIPGLYVAGADAGGMYGLSYVDVEGGTLGFAYTSGRLAGENAASYINK
ncbi:FAD-dependent oxidoreductase [Alkalibaculum sporogenes]|nr:FAD-dependent oxidoreductase [Alkalibaculum sporogenes]